MRVAPRHARDQGFDGRGAGRRWGPYSETMRKGRSIRNPRPLRLRSSVARCAPAPPALRPTALAGSNKTTAKAAMPSPRPIGAQAIGAGALHIHALRSAVQPFGQGSPQRLHGGAPSRGSWATTVVSRLPRASPPGRHPAPSPAPAAPRWRCPRARRPRRGSGRPGRPRPGLRAGRWPPRGAARRRPECPARPRACGISTPPSQSGRPSTRAWASKPWPMRMALIPAPLRARAPPPPGLPGG